MSKTTNKILSEGVELSANSTQEQINEAWGAKLDEARQQVTAQLREEYARKYEHDKNVLAEAVDKFLTDKIRAELEEFAEDKKQLVAERVAYKTKVTEHTKMLNKFITGQLAKEVKELHSDKSNMNEGFKQLENFVLKQLAEEIREFRKDKRGLVEQKVKMVSEGKQHLAETKKAFIARAAKVVESNINKVLRTEIEQFKGDIKVARENEFGRRVFESVVGEYMTSYLNEGSEVKKLQKMIEAKDVELNAVKKASTQKEQIAEGLHTKLRVANDRIGRDKVMSSLMAPLAKAKRAVMAELLESVQTKDLEKQFDKYLPAVLNETAAPRNANRTTRLSERTGNRATNGTLNESADTADFNNELDSLRSLAGLK